MIYNEQRLISAVSTALFLFLLLASPFVARSEVNVAILAQRPDGQAVDTGRALPDYQVIVLRSDGFTLVDTKGTRNMREDKEWEAAFDFPEGEEVILKLRRYDGTDYYIEDAKRIRLATGARYILVSKTRPVESISITAQTPEGKPVDTRKSLPNYAVYMYKAGGKILYDRKETLNMRKEMEWELAPNFVEGEKVVLRLKRYNGQDQFLEDEKVVVLRDEASYTLTARTRPVQDVTIVARAPDGGPTDRYKDLPNYEVKIYRGDGTTYYDGKDVRNLRKGMIWNTDINAVEGEEAVLRIVRYDGTDSIVEASRRIKLISGQTYTVTSNTVPVEDVEILVTDDNGQVIDEKKGYPEYSVFIYQPDGRTRYDGKPTRNLRKGKLWELSPNFIEGDEAVILLRQYNGVEWTDLNRGKTRMIRGLKIAITPSRFHTTASVSKGGKGERDAGEVHSLRKMRLVYLHADWCGSSQKMDQTIQAMQAEISPRMEVIWLDMDKDRPMIETLMKRIRVGFLPTIILLDERDTLIQALIGYRSEEEMKAWLNVR